MRSLCSPFGLPYRWVVPGERILIVEDDERIGATLLRALAAEEAEKGKRVVVVVDEAHLLSAEQLEELRLLTNADMDSHPLCHNDGCR